jgi:prephenate dehydrogenase
MWTSIFRANRGPILKALGTMEEQIAAFKYAVMTDDEDAIRQWWNDARECRHHFEARHSATKGGQGSSNSELPSR